MLEQPHTTGSLEPGITVFLKAALELGLKYFVLYLTDRLKKLSRHQPLTAYETLFMGQESDV